MHVGTYPALSVEPLIITEKAVISFLDGETMLARVRTAGARHTSLIELKQRL